MTRSTSSLLASTEAVPPLPGSSVEVAPGILWARLPVPFPLKHVNVYLIEDYDGWTVVDAGADTPQARDQWRRLLASTIGSRPIRRLIVTHFHPDHVGAAGWLVGLTGASLMMTPAEHALARRTFLTAESHRDGYRGFFAMHGVEARALEEVLAAGYDYRLGVGEPPEDFVAIDAGDRLTLGGRTLEVVTGSGHSPRLAMLHDAHNELLLCADQVLQRISPNVSVRADRPDANPLGDYLASLRRLRDVTTPGTFTLPGHEVPIRNLHGRIDELSAHHADRCRAIERACRSAALTAAELVPHVFGRAFTHAQLGHAMAETVAHLNLMLAESRLRREERGGTLVFRTV